MGEWAGKSENMLAVARVIALGLVVAAVSAQDTITLCQFTSNNCGGDSLCEKFTDGECKPYGKEGYASIKVSWTCGNGKMLSFTVIKYPAADCDTSSGANTIFRSSTSGIGDKQCFETDSSSSQTEYESLYLTDFPSNCADSGDCFAETARVELDDGSFVPMTQLELGDRVRVSASEFSPVVFWGHRDADTVSANFVLAELASGRQIMLTANHLAYVNGKLVPAGTIRVSDLMKDVELDEESAVEAVQHGLRAKGLYNPHTAHGDIVVDGVVVSTYGVVDARIAHSLLMIERMLRNVGLSLLGDMLEKQTPLVLRRIMSIAS